MLAANFMICDEIILDAICEKLSDGESLKDICDSEGFPHRTTVNRWMLSDAEVASRIARAREFGQHAAIDDCRRIADTATPDTWQVAKLRIWERQWQAAKVAPKAYGEKLDVNHSGKIDRDISEEELSDRLAALQSKYADTRGED